MAEAGHRPQSCRLGRQGLRRVFGLGLLALLAACTTTAPGPRGPAVAPPPPPPVKVAPPSSLPEDKARHRVALLVPLTGPNAGVGSSIANAAVLALADTHDGALRVTTYDTGTGAAAAAQKAIGDGNRLILGPLLADDVRAVTPIASAAGVPVLAFSNDANVAGNDVWLLGYQPGQSIERVVRYARSKGLTRFAGLMPQNVYGRSATTNLLRTVEAAKGTVVTMQTFDRTPKGLATAVAKVAQSRPDAVLIADSGRGAVLIADQLKKSGGRLLGTELWGAEAGLRAVPSLQGAWYASVDDALFAQLATRYRARYGKTPYRLSSLGYDAVLLTVRIARNWADNAPFPVDRLSDDSGFVGIDGAFRFDDSHLAERALAIHEIGGGDVSPAPKSF